MFLCCRVKFFENSLESDTSELVEDGAEFRNNFRWLANIITFLALAKSRPWPKRNGRGDPCRRTILQLKIKKYIVLI